MRLKMLFLQILIILPLTTFGERLGYTEELVRDLHAVIKKSGTIGDLINNLPVSDKERKSYWEFIEKYGVENIAISKSTVKSRQIIWKLESGRQIVQDFSRLSVGEVLINGKVVSIKGRSLEQIYEEIKNVTSSRVGANYQYQVPCSGFEDCMFAGEPLKSFLAWMLPTAFAGWENSDGQKLGYSGVGTLNGLMQSISANQQRIAYNKSMGLPDNFCPPPQQCVTDGVAWFNRNSAFMYSTAQMFAYGYQKSRSDQSLDENGNPVWIAALSRANSNNPDLYVPYRRVTTVEYNGIKSKFPKSRAGTLITKVFENW